MHGQLCKLCVCGGGGLREGGRYGKMLCFHTLEEAWGEMEAEFSTPFSISMPPLKF